MKRTLFVLILVAFIIFARSPRNTEKLDREVVFWTLQMNDFAPYINKLIENFEYENPEIKIKWIDVSFSEGEKRTLASILSDNPPSLVNLNPDFSAMLAQKGALEEISENDLKEFNPQIVNSLRVNGKIYSIPWYATSAVTIYNKELLNRAQIKAFPKTYTDLGYIAKQVKAKSGAYVFMPTITENDTMLKILNKSGINSAQNINSIESIQIFDFYKKLYNEELIPTESITQTHRESLEKYMSGSIVMFQAGANFLNMIKENAPDVYKKTDVAPQIKGTIGQNDFSLMNFIIPLKAKNKNEALKFALYLTNAENQLELAKLTGVLATNNRVLQDDYYKKYDGNDLMAKARVISASQLDKIEPVLKQSNNQKEVNILINTAVQSILLNKETTQKILDDVAHKWTQLQ